nr:tryptophan synthase subunit beta [Candidatus Sigynarchaeota archaeon]
MKKLDYYGKYPSSDGRFGKYGGMYVPETLVPAIMELKEAYARIKDDPAFVSSLDRLRKDFAGRPTPLTFASNLSKKLGCKIYLKREDL